MRLIDADMVLAAITKSSNQWLNAQAKTEEPKKRGRPAGSKKPFDIGKAKACREAGWSIAKIADEMRVSTATVSTKLKEAGMNITAVMDA